MQTKRSSLAIDGANHQTQTKCSVIFSVLSFTSRSVDRSRKLPGQGTEVTEHVSEGQDEHSAETLEGGGDGDLGGGSEAHSERGLS